jgi:hypothetical protein
MHRHDEMIPRIGSVVGLRRRCACSTYKAGSRAASATGAAAWRFRLSGLAGSRDAPFNGQYSQGRICSRPSIRLGCTRYARTAVKARRELVGQGFRPDLPNSPDREESVQVTAKMLQTG